MTSAIMLPFSAIHHVMTFQGFRRIRFNQQSAYRARFDDASTKRSYRLTIPIQNHDNITCSVKVADAFLEDGDSTPLEVVEAVESKLYEVGAYLQDEREKRKPDFIDSPEQFGSRLKPV
jgi:hypothetical protein